MGRLVLAVPQYGRDTNWSAPLGANRLGFGIDPVSRVFGKKTMARYRTHSIEFKRQVAQEYLAGETLHGLSKRHDIQRQLIRVWVRKYEEGALDEDA